MRAVVRDGDLRLEGRDVPVLGPGQLLLKVHACGVGRTDLHLLDGEGGDRAPAARARPPDRRHKPLEEQPLEPAPVGCHAQPR